jgi:hypothetical protein
MKFYDIIDETEINFYKLFKNNYEIVYIDNYNIYNS